MIWIFLWYDATWYSDFDKTSLLKVADFRTRVSRCCFLARFMSHGKFTTRQHNLSCAEKLRYPSWYIPTTIALVVQRVPSSDVGDRCNAVAQPPRASWKHQWNRKLTSFVQQIFCHLLCGEVCMCNKKYISYMLCRLSMIVSYCWYTLIYIYIPSDLAWNVLEPYTSEAAAMWHSLHRHDMTFHTMPQCSFRFRYNVGDILCNRCSMQTPSSKIRFLSRRGQIWVSAKHDPRWKFPNNWLICVAP